MASGGLKLNCWEYKKCAHEKDCPAFTKRMGRMCWLIAGTMCGGSVQGEFAQKIGNCTKCDFYQSVFSLGPSVSSSPPRR